ncbi:YEATS domain-containing protein 2, partial [Cladochytrium tenue]
PTAASDSAEVEAIAPRNSLVPKTFSKPLPPVVRVGAGDTAAIAPDTKRVARINVYEPSDPIDVGTDDVAMPPLPTVVAALTGSGGDIDESRGGDHMDVDNINMDGEPGSQLPASETPGRDSAGPTNQSQQPEVSLPPTVSTLRPGADGSRFYVTRRVIVGNDPDISTFVSHIVFFLHRDYEPNDVIKLGSPPFRLTRYGWGEFTIRMRLYFVNPERNRPKDLIYALKLDRLQLGTQVLGGEQWFDIELDRNTAFAPARDPSQPAVGQPRTSSPDLHQRRQRNPRGATTGAIQAAHQPESSGLAPEHKLQSETQPPSQPQPPEQNETVAEQQLQKQPPLPPSEDRLAPPQPSVQDSVPTLLARLPRRLFCLTCGAPLAKVPTTPATDAGTAPLRCLACPPYPATATLPSSLSPPAALLAALRALPASSGASPPSFTRPPATPLYPRTRPWPPPNGVVWAVTTAAQVADAFPGPDAVIAVENGGAGEVDAVGAGDAAVAAPPPLPLGSAQDQVGALLFD